MDKPSNKEFFSAILASSILAPHLEQNSDLSELIKSPHHPDIHYFETPAPAAELAPALKQRLKVTAAKNISSPNLDATKQLVAFIEEHPDSLIYNVTFNGKQQHYGVRCGLVDGQIRVICVMTGGRIPDEILRESNQ